ncbi:MAG: SDR family oxidoreductase [Ignavibacteriae bacterium]|nr:SDR family oxidoreductase [Ignavibacteriota bacterium]
MSTRSGKNTILITGATDGIGIEFSRLYAGLKYNIIATGRNEGKLSSLKTELENKNRITVNTFAADLSKPEEIFKLKDYIDSMETKIDILINNAGSGVLGEFAETDLQKELSMISVNITALTVITKAVLKKMLINGEGKILNIASTAAFKPGPMMAVYYATKAYVLSFSQAIACENRGSGISITVLCPGPVNTKLLKESADIELRHAEYDKMADPKDIALSGMKALDKNNLVYIPGIRNKFNAMIVKIIPSKLLSDILYKSKKNLF